MPHRDDHDAAIARADALQRELDHERASDGEQKARLEQAEKELASAKERLSSAEAELQRARREARPGPGAASPSASPSAQSVSGSPVPQPPSRAGLLFGGALLAVFLICGGLVIVCSSHEPGEDPGGTAREAAEAQQRPAPTPPFVADTLVAEGLSQLGGDHLLQSISIDYVRPDGTLDPTYGRIAVDSSRAPEPPPPDDPSRPTGAPSENPTAATLAVMMASCPQPTWTPTDGWQVGEGSCMTIGELPVGRPTCSTVKLWALARQEDAPEGLAKITARWFIDVASSEHGVHWEWTWHFELSDDRRGVHFTQDFSDRLCNEAH